MMRAFHIVSMVITVLLFFIAVYYVNEVHRERYMSIYDSYGYGSDYGYRSYRSHSDSSLMAGLVSTLIVLVLLTVHILSLVKIKTTTMKVFSILGIIFSGIMVLLGLLIVASDGGATYDEVGPFFVIYAVPALAFHIVGTVHAFKKSA